MHSISIFTAIMAAIAASAAQPYPEAHIKRAITGRGQLNAISNGAAAGCVTSHGLLTLDENKCAPFNARQSGSKFELIVADVNHPRCAARSNNAFHSFACSTTATATKFSADGNLVVNPATGETDWLVETLPSVGSTAHFYSKLEGGGASIKLRFVSL